MTLTSGTRLGPYELIAPLGAGGMGEVYKARDTRLDRNVAVKVLPSHLSADAALKERFEREARAVSSLNHPHICVLHDIGSQNGIDYIVMEHLEGESLADRLKKGPVPLEQALRCATEIAEALDRAHRAGIVHRDLKPGNVMLTRSGAKLLDFGLAKHSRSPFGGSEAVSSLPTESKPLTEAGTLMGTFQYMSPEQAEGKDADARSDLFAFGAVLYEMVTGQRAFTGGSQPALISAILRDQPRPLTTLRPTAPPALERLVGACLAKDPDERWQSAGDLARELTWILEQSVASIPRRVPRPWALAALFAVAITGTAVATWLWNRPRPATRAVSRLTVTIPPDSVFSPHHPVAISPDGTRIVYAAGRTSIGGSDPGRLLFLRSLDRVEATPIPGTESGEQPFFSPDGRWVGFWSQGKLKKISLEGGPSVTVCEVTHMHGAVWGPDDTIYFNADRNRGIDRVPASGGTPAAVTRLERGELRHNWPELLPAGRGIVFTVQAEGAAAAWRIDAQSLTTGERRLVVDGGAHARYLTSGHLLFGREGTLEAAPFDVKRLAITGPAVPIVPAVDMDPASGNVTRFAASANGTLIYLPPPDISGRRLVWVDRRGVTRPALNETRGFVGASLSPEGDRVALQVNARAGVGETIWLADLRQGMLARLTFAPQSEGGPVWTPDGRRVLFWRRVGSSFQVVSKAADGTGAEDVLDAAPINQPGSVSPDGRWLALTRSGRQNDIVLRSLGPDRRLERFVETPGQDRAPRFSPDGRFLAYWSDDTGRGEIYVRPFPATGAQWLVSTEGGEVPVWAPHGRELFYRSGDRMFAVPVALTPTFRVTGVPRALFESRDFVASLSQSYDVAPDGQHFLMIQEPPNAPTQPLVVVQNAPEELKRLALASGR